MGISINPLHFLCQTQGALGKTLMLGRQDNNLGTNSDLIAMIFSEAGLDVDVAKVMRDTYADTILRYLGASEIVSMDASDYEGADIIHDLNKPVPQELWSQFDTVIDGGTLEHVFHVPNALNSIAKMLKVGGRFIGMSPANNWFGHGFYQFSPELMWRFCQEFGFQVNRVDLYIRGQHPKAISIPDPEQQQRRLEIKTPNNRIDLMTDAIKMKEVYPDCIYQSDYQSLWDKKTNET